MNPCEAEILSVTKYRLKKKYKDRQEYLTCLLREVDGLPQDKFEYLLSNQTYAWYEAAATAFKTPGRALPELPTAEVEELRYPRDEEGYVSADEPVITPDELRGNIKAMLEAQDEADVALNKLEEATNKVKPKRNSKYRKAEAIEGARHYLFPEYDRYGLLMGSMRQKAAEMFERGATMKAVKEVTGYTVYNLLRKLKEDGHSVENAGGVVKLTYKGDKDAKPST